MRRYTNYGVGVDDGAFVSVRDCVVRDCHFEAFFAGTNAGHAPPQCQSPSPRTHSHQFDNR